jgi:hypothetical protein
MNEIEMNQIRNSSLGSKMWMALGGLLAVGMAIIFLRETPAMRRELKLMRM